MAPKETKWEMLPNSALAPKSASAGPSKTEGRVARCYPPTAEGALLAAANIYVRSLGEGGEEVLDQQYSPKLSPELREAAKSVTKQAAQISGFRFAKGIENDEVQVWLSLGAVVEGKYGEVAGSQTMHWNGNDWVVRGDLTPPLDRNPVGFVAWKAF